MLRLGRTAVDLATTLQLQQRGVRVLQSAYQTQASAASRGANPLSVAVAGAAALSVSLNLQEHVTHSRAAVEPSAQHKWQLFDQIGAGAFGVVRIGMHGDSGEVAAVKIVPLENPNKNRSYPALEREISALKLVKTMGGHKSIIDLRDVYVEGRKVFLVTELARGGELFEQIAAYGSLTETNAKDVTREIASALGFLHRNGLVHKDVKPENILFSARMSDDGNRKGNRNNASLVKLADFGSAGPAGSTDNLDEIGTAAYLPPELLTSGLCTSACDMWALGCVLYIMLSGSHPFDLDGMTPDSEVEHRIKNEPITFAYGAWDHVSAEAKDLVSRLLTKDPAMRLTADEMMLHPWMTASSEANADTGIFRAPTLLAGQPLPMSPA